MNTYTQKTDFTPVDQDLYAAAFRLLDPDPTPEPAAPAVPAALAAPAPVPLTATLPVRLTGPVEKVLTDALAFLDTHGWTRYSLINTEGARCSIGALRAAAGSRNAAYRDAGLAVHKFSLGQEVTTDDAEQVYALIHKVMAKPSNKVLLHRETIDDAVGGILAGYLVWSGMVEQPVLAVAVVQEILKRPLGPEGRNLVPGAGRMPYLWSVVNGVGDQLLDGRYRLHDCTRDEFLAFTTDALVAGMTRPLD